MNEAVKPSLGASGLRLLWISVLVIVVDQLTKLWIERTMLLVTGAFSLVYVVGTAAAIRLLPRGTWVWRGAVVAFVATLGLLALTRQYLLPQVVVAVASMLWMWHRGSQARRSGPSDLAEAVTD
jgi:amino acid efflux transporter